MHPCCSWNPWLKRLRLERKGRNMGAEICVGVCIFLPPCFCQKKSGCGGQGSGGEASVLPVPSVVRNCGGGAYPPQAQPLLNTRLRSESFGAAGRWTLISGPFPWRLTGADGEKTSVWISVHQWLKNCGGDAPAAGDSRRGRITLRFRLSRGIHNP